MRKICLSKNGQKSKFPDLTYAWGKGVNKGYENEEILKCALSRLLKLRTATRAISQFSQLIYNNEAQKYVYDTVKIRDAGNPSAFSRR